MGVNVSIVLTPITRTQNISDNYTNHKLYVHYTNIKTPTSPINSSLYHSRGYFTTLRPPTMYKPLGIALMSVPSKRPSIE